MNVLRTKIVIFLALLSLALSACAPSSAMAAQLTASPTSTIVPFSTPVPTGVASGAPATIVPGPDGGTGSNTNVITLDNNNQLITLHVGESFLLKLGQEYQWSPVIDNQAVISRIPNIAVVVGAQGIYLAHAAGTAVMTVTGDPACRQSKPACMMPSLVFTLHIEVQP